MASGRRERDRGPSPSPGDGAAAANSGAALEDELAQLQRDYAAALPQKLAAWRAAADQWHQCPSNAQALERFRRLSHQLYGSASSFGFSDVGLEARRILGLLPRSILDLSSFSPQSWRHIQTALDAADVAASA